MHPRAPTVRPDLAAQTSPLCREMGAAPHHSVCDPECVLSPACTLIIITYIYYCEGEAPMLDCWPDG